MRKDRRLKGYCWLMYGVRLTQSEAKHVIRQVEESRGYCCDYFTDADVNSVQQILATRHPRIALLSNWEMRRDIVAVRKNEKQKQKRRSLYATQSLFPEFEMEVHQ